MNQRRWSPGSRSGFTLIELMIVVAILGILAVVAIPAFVRYMRIAKTAEAYRNLNKIIQGQTAYFAAPKFDAAGQRIHCQFVSAANMNGPFDPITAFSPAFGACCTDGEPDGKCEPNETRWEASWWKAVLFKLSDKHYYSYATGSGINIPTDYAVAAAVGDLDCDGTYGSFYMMLRGDMNPDGITNCRSQQMGSIRVINETE